MTTANTTGNTVQAQIIERRFKHNTQTFPDPNPKATLADVQAMLALTNPKLANASINGPVLEDGFRTYTFTNHVGVKG